MIYVDTSVVLAQLLAEPPAVLMAASVASRSASVRATSATRAPDAASRVAMARPMPRVAPVTMATLPLTSRSVVSCSVGSCQPLRVSMATQPSAIRSRHDRPHPCARLRSRAGRAGHEQGGWGYGSAAFRRLRPFQVSVSGAMSAPSLNHVAVPFATVTSANASSLLATRSKTGPRRRSETSRSNDPSIGEGEAQPATTERHHGFDFEHGRMLAERLDGIEGLALAARSQSQASSLRWMAAHSTTRPIARGRNRPQPGSSNLRSR